MWWGNWPWRLSYWAASAHTLFSLGEEFNTWITSSVPQKSMDGILQNILYWPPPEGYDSLQFQKDSMAKQELQNLMLNPFWDSPRKYCEINQKFPLLSVLILTLSSLSSTDGGWELGRTYNKQEPFWDEISPSQCKMLLSLNTLPVLFSILSWASAMTAMFHQRAQHTVSVTDWSFALSEGLQVKSKPAALERGRQLKRT